MEKLLKILADANGQIDFANTEGLIDNGLIDSLELMEIISELEAEWDIEIGMEEIVPENFNSASAMMRMIERLSAK